MGAPSDGRQGGGYWRRSVQLESARVLLACGGDFCRDGAARSPAPLPPPSSSSFALVRGDTLELVSVLGDGGGEGGSPAASTMRVVCRQPLASLGDAALARRSGEGVRAMARVPVPGGGGDPPAGDGGHPAADGGNGQDAADAYASDALALLTRRGGLMLLRYRADLGRLAVVAASQAPLGDGAGGAGAGRPPVLMAVSPDGSAVALSSRAGERVAVVAVEWAQEGRGQGSSPPCVLAPPVVFSAALSPSMVETREGGVAAAAPAAPATAAAAAPVAPAAAASSPTLPAGQQPSRSAPAVTGMAWRSKARDEGGSGFVLVVDYQLQQRELEWRPSGRALLLLPASPPARAPDVGQIAAELEQQRLSADESQGGVVAAADLPPTEPQPAGPSPPDPAAQDHHGGQAAPGGVLLSGGRRVVVSSAGALVVLKAQGDDDPEKDDPEKDGGQQPPDAPRWRRPLPAARRQARLGGGGDDLVTAMAAAPRDDRLLVAYASGSLALFRLTPGGLGVEAALGSRPAEPRYGCVPSLPLPSSASAPSRSVGRSPSAAAPAPPPPPMLPRLFTLTGARGVQVLTPALPMAQLARSSAFSAGAGGATGLWALPLQPGSGTAATAATTATAAAFAPSPPFLAGAASVVVASFDSATRALALVRGGGKAHGDGPRLRDVTADLAAAGLDAGAQTLAAGLLMRDARQQQQQLYYHHQEQQEQQQQAPHGSGKYPVALLQVTSRGVNLVPLPTQGGGGGGGGGGRGAGAGAGAGGGGATWLAARAIIDRAPTSPAGESAPASPPARVFAAAFSGDTAALAVTVPTAGAGGAAGAAAAWLVLLRAVDPGPPPPPPLPELQQQQQQVLLPALGGGDNGARRLKRARDSAEAAASIRPSSSGGGDGCGSWGLRQVFACPLAGQISCVHIIVSPSLPGSQQATVTLCGRYDGSVAAVVCGGGGGGAADTRAAEPLQLHGDASTGGGGSDSGPVPHSIASAGPSAVVIAFRDGHVGLYALDLGDVSLASGVRGSPLRLLSRVRTGDGPLSLIGDPQNTAVLFAAGERRMWRLDVVPSGGGRQRRLELSPLELLPPPLARGRAAATAAASALTLQRLPPWARVAQRSKDALLISLHDGALVLAAAEEEEQEEQQQHGGGVLGKGGDGRVLGWVARGHDVRGAIALEGGALLIGRCASGGSSGGGGSSSGSSSRRSYLAAFDCTAPALSSPPFVGGGVDRATAAAKPATTKTQKDAPLAEWRAPGHQELTCVDHWDAPRVAVLAAFGGAERALAGMSRGQPGQQQQQQQQQQQPDAEGLPAPGVASAHAALEAALDTTFELVAALAAPGAPDASGGGGPAAAAAARPVDVRTAAASAARDPRSHEFGQLEPLLDSSEGGGGGSGSGSGGGSGSGSGRGAPNDAVFGLANAPLGPPLSAAGGGALRKDGPGQKINQATRLIMERLVAASTAEVRASAAAAASPWVVVCTRVPRRIPRPHPTGDPVGMDRAGDDPEAPDEAGDDGQGEEEDEEEGGGTTATPRTTASCTTTARTPSAPARGSPSARRCLARSSSTPAPPTATTAMIWTWITRSSRSPLRPTARAERAGSESPALRRAAQVFPTPTSTAPGRPATATAGASTWCSSCATAAAAARPPPPPPLPLRPPRLLRSLLAPTLPCAPSCACLRP